MAPRHSSACFVTTIPGLSPFVIREAAARGLRPSHQWRDGRSDYIAFDLAAPHLQTADAVFARVATLLVDRRAHATAAKLPLDRIGSRAVRVVVRLRDERRFRRTELRAAVEKRLGRRASPDASAELWVVQSGASTLTVGLRLDRPAPRRPVELPGSLPPPVAAAMVSSVAAPGAVLDPCCGSGTIAVVAQTARRRAVALDNDPHAVVAARANGARLVGHADARRLPFPPATFAAVVVNLPFGRQHLVQGSPVTWYRRVLTEALRVAPQAVVLAAPTTPFRQALGRLDVRLHARHDVVIRGNAATIWDIRKIRGTAALNNM